MMCGGCACACWRSSKAGAPWLLVSRNLSPRTIKEIVDATKLSCFTPIRNQPAGLLTGFAKLWLEEEKKDETKRIEELKRKQKEREKAKAEQRKQHQNSPPLGQP